MTLTCRDDGGVSSQSQFGLWFRMQHICSSGGTEASGVGRRLAGSHFLQPHHASRSGWELAGHPRDHQTPADEDCHQLLHR